MCARLPETGRVRQRHRRCRLDADAGVAERRYTSAVTETVVQPQISKHWPASIYRRPDGVVEQALSPARMRGIVQSGEGELWVDINSMDMHQHALLEKVFEFHPLAVEDTLSPRTRVKLEEYDRYVFVVMAGIRLESTTPDPYDLETFNLYYFLGKNFLVTVHAVTALGCEAVRERLQRSADLLARGAEATMHAIIDQAVDAYFPLVEQINAHVDRLEERLFEEFDEGLIHEIFKAKRAAFALRRHIGPLREVLNILTNRPSSYIRPETHHGTVSAPGACHEAAVHRRDRCAPPDRAGRHLRHELQPHAPGPRPLGLLGGPRRHGRGVGGHHVVAPPPQMALRLAAEVVSLKTKHPFVIARGGGDDYRVVWVRVTDADGAEGWGEADPSKYYGETADTVLAMLKKLEPYLPKDSFDLEAAEARFAQVVPKNGAARAAVSAALHDLVGKRLGQPLWRLWGLDPARAPRSSFTIGIDTADQIRRKVAEASTYPILKVKLGTDRDEEILSVIRDATDKPIRVDANAGWTRERAIAMLPVLREYGVEFVEQPLPPEDLEGTAAVRRRGVLPVVVDESCLVAADIPRVADAADGINIKLAKCGSLREALRMIATARAHGMLVMVGCMIESSLGITAAAHFTPLVDAADLDGAALTANDPFVGATIDGGEIRLPTGPGLGVRRR